MGGLEKANTSQSPEHSQNLGKREREKEINVKGFEKVPLLTEALSCFKSAQRYVTTRCQYLLYTDEILWGK